jgi:hypothetical protein
VKRGYETGRLDGYCSGSGKKELAVNFNQLVLSLSTAFFILLLKKFFTMLYPQGCG